MTRIAVVTTAIALAATVLAPGAAAGKGFKYGVAAGDVSSSSALLWTRSDKPTKLTLLVSTDKSFGPSGLISHGVTSKSSHDNTVTVRITKLQPGKRYFYRFTSSAGQSDVGQFMTAPKAGQAKTINFAYTGDEDAQPAKGKSKPFWNNFQVFARLAGEHNNFNINLGDTIYSDTEVGAKQTNGVFQPVTPVAKTLKQKWAKYRMNLALANYQKARRAAGMYNQWDDHEFINDFSKPEHGNALYTAGRNAFLDYMPTHYTSKDGIYRSFRWGKNAEFFFPDERSFRSAKASANHVCDNPQTHAPDVAPTLPQDKRNFYALLVPSLSQPVSQACLNTLNSSSRTFLGTRQLNILEKALMQSTATFKIIANEDPIMQFYALPYDRWEGYAAERIKFLTFLKQHVKNALFITTDTHAVMTVDARLKTFEAGGPVNSGITDFVTGPAATRNYDIELALATGKSNAGDQLRKYAFKPAPPAGMGMTCARLNIFSYTEVKVTSKSVTLTPKDLNGKTFQDRGSGPNPKAPKCGPFTVNKK